MSDIHVTYDGDTHWLQCFSDDPGREKGVIVDPIDIGDSWATLAEKVAEHQAQHGCAPKPEPAKVIVVTEQGGRERRFDADSWDVGSEFGTVSVERSSREDDPVVALYNHGAWLSVREDGAEAPDVSGPYFRQGKKLAIALDALRAIGERFTSDDLDEDLCRVLDKIAGNALDQIADVDL
jgi:hypothetical protein